MRNSHMWVKPCESESESKVLISGDFTPVRSHKLTNSFATSENFVLGFDLVVHGVAHGWRTTCTLEMLTQSAFPLCGPIQGVQNCMCDWARSQAGATAAIHRPTCRLGRALTLRFVTLAVRSLSRSTEWCSARQIVMVRCCLRVLTTQVSHAPPDLGRMSWRPRGRVVQHAIGTVCTLLSLRV